MSFTEILEVLEEFVPEPTDLIAMAMALSEKMNRRVFTVGEYSNSQIPDTISALLHNVAPPRGTMDGNIARDLADEIIGESIEHRNVENAIWSLNILTMDMCPPKTQWRLEQTTRGYVFGLYPEKDTRQLELDT